MQVDRRHALAVGLIPALGAWATVLIDVTLMKAGKRLIDVADQCGSHRADVFVHGAVSLNQGFIVSSLVLAATMVHLIDRQFHKAAIWMAAAAVISGVGQVHAYELTGDGIQNRFGFMAAGPFAAGYGLTAVLLVVLHAGQRAEQLQKPDANGPS